MCPSSRSGPTCAECASGYSGSDCAPNGLTKIAGNGWFGKFVFFALVAGGLYLCCCTPLGSNFATALKNRNSDGPGGAYSKLNTEADFFDDDLDHNEASTLDVSSSSADFAAGPIASTELKPSRSSAGPQSHSGLAI
jgi:hypothetical protein